MRAIALVLVLALSPPAVVAQVYKWVDKDGRTHYGEKPPEDAKSARKLDTPPPGPSTGSGTEAWRERDARSKAQRANSQAEEARAAEERARDQPQRDAACANANRRLQVLRMQVPVYTRDKAGNRTYLEDDQRTQEIALEEKRAKENCGP